MGSYNCNNDLGGSQQNLSSSYKTLITALAGSTPRRGRLYDLTVGADGTPADNALIFNACRMTADDGTKTNVTPNPIDPADPAFTGLSRANFSAEGTVATPLLTFTINQRATFEWVSAPECELVYPATSNNGLAVRAKSPAYTSTVLAGFHVEE